MKSKTELESEAMYHLEQSWNKFSSLPSTHPDDNPDFRRAIHECQRIIAVRAMRRIDPNTWPTYSDENSQVSPPGAAVESE